MAFAVEENEPSNPVDVRLLCSTAVVARTNGISDAIEQA